MTTQQLKLIVLSILAATHASVGQADESNFSWSGKVQAGYQYDSNVGVQELDENTEQSDNVRVLQGELALKWNPWANLHIKTGANHIDYAYSSFEDFDLSITTFSGDINYEFDLVTAGVSRHDATARLAGDSFMDYQQDTLYLSRLWGTRWFTRIEQQQIDKTFAELPERNAEARAYSGDVYWFTASAKTFVNVGYTTHDETAVNPELSYKGNQIRVKWQTQTSGWGGEHTLQLGWQWQQRDYRETLASIDEPRDEQRHAIQAKWTIPVSQRIELVPSVEYIDNESNFAAVDYQETLAGVNFSLRF